MAPLALVRDSGQDGDLSQVAVPAKFYQRIRLGDPALDRVFGPEDSPGVVPGSVFLVTGEPGAGKSTLMLQKLADSLSLSGIPVVYNANEESPAMVKMMADRLGVQGNFRLSQRQEVDQLVSAVIASGAKVLIQDSVQTLLDGSLAGRRLILSVGRKLVRLAKDHDVTVFLVGQVNKDGKMAGPMMLKHEVDAHLHLSRHRKTGERQMEMTKNRFGDAGEPRPFWLTASGLTFRREEPVIAEQSKKESPGAVALRWLRMVGL